MVYNGQGQEILKAKEVNDCFTRNFYGASRPFDMEIKDLTYGYENDIISLRRPNCYNTCKDRLEVYSVTGTGTPDVLVGSVEEKW